MDTQTPHATDADRRLYLKVFRSAIRQRDGQTGRRHFCHEPTYRQAYLKRVLELRSCLRAETTRSSLLNEDGRISANTECPFRSKCEIAAANRCHHLSAEHSVPFSCATARGFDLLQRR